MQVQSLLLEAQHNSNTDEWFVKVEEREKCIPKEKGNRHTL